LVRIGPTAWPFTGFIHTDRQLDKYILDLSHFGKEVASRGGQLY